MPSFLHQSLVVLFRERPELAVDFLRDVHHAELPHYSELKTKEGKLELSDIVPGEYNSDLVVLLLDGKPVLAIVVEVQLEVKSRKRFTWPAYVAAIRAQYQCPCVLFVYCVDEQTAAWAAEPISVGFGFEMRPLVVGPKGVPIVDSPEVPVELAVMSVMAHGKGDIRTAVRVAEAATAAVRAQGGELSPMYYDLIELSLSEAARKEFAMLPQGYEYQSESMRRSFQESKAEAILDILDARDIAVTDEQRQRIKDCQEFATLRAWVRKAATVASADELFTE